MRVLVVMPRVGPEGGAEQSLAGLAPRLIEQGVELHLALLRDYQVMVPQLEIDGVVIHDLSGCGGLVRQVGALRQVVRSVRPDLVHATLWEATLPAQLAAIRSGVPLLISWTVTPNTADDLGELAAGGWKRRAVELVDAVLGRVSRAKYHAVTDGVGTTMGRSLGVDPRRIHVGERGRDPASFEAPIDPAVLRNELGLPTDCRVVLAVGRQDPQKGYSTLLDAFDSVAEHRPDVRLLIAGRPGAATPALERQLAGLRHGDRVHFLGQRQDVPRLLGSADLVVCASWREGAAGALIEAMASATPIVSVRLDGLDGVLVDGENARVVPRAELGAALGEVLDDDALRSRLGTAGQRTFSERFTLGRSADRMREIYHEVATSGGSGTQRHRR